jgi:hypothetical protein
MPTSSAKARWICQAAALVLVLLFSGVVDAGSDIPKVISAGFDAYGAEGIKAALTKWTEGGPMEGDKDVANLACLFSQISGTYGKFTGYSPITTKQISPSSKFIYIELKFEKGPVFGRFFCYKPETEWILAAFHFNTEPQNILPESLFK